MPDTTEFSITFILFEDEDRDPTSAYFGKYILPMIPRIGETFDVRDDYSIPTVDAVATVIGVKYVLRNTENTFGMTYECRVECIKKVR